MACDGEVMKKRLLAVDFSQSGHSELSMDIITECPLLF